MDTLPGTEASIYTHGYSSYRALRSVPRMRIAREALRESRVKLKNGIGDREDHPQFFCEGSRSRATNGRYFNMHV